jgi:hypothetical protein
LLDLRFRDGSRAQDPETITSDFANGGFNANGTWTAIQHGIDSVTEFRNDMFRAGW